MRHSLVIPAYNEAERIERTLRAYRPALPADAEIIVVVNGSTDATADLSRRLAEELGGIRVLEIREAIGKGAAVREGLAVSQGTWVGFVDADLATSPEHWQAILAAAQRCDGAFGSRWARGADVQGRTPLRAVTSRVYAWLVRALFGLPFRDTQCGAKVFHRRFLAGYLANSRVNDLAFDVEMLLLLTRAGARLEEVPTLWVAQPGSSSLGHPIGFIQHGWDMLRSLLRLRWRRQRPVPQPAPR